MMGVNCQLTASPGGFRRRGCQAEEREVPSRRCNRPGGYWEDQAEFGRGEWFICCNQLEACVLPILEGG